MRIKMDKNEIRMELLRLCKKCIDDDIKLLEVTINEAQEEANFHKGAMQSRYDTFKEEAQAKKDAYIRQLHEKNKIMVLLNSIHNMSNYEKVVPGAIVETTLSNYFIVAYIFDKPVKINDKSFLPISIASPLGRSLQNKVKGDNIIFNNKIFMIEDIY